MANLPTEVITFLFTDIEGSTRLWEQHAEAMRDALARHDALATALFAQYGGALVKARGEGDSLFAVFPRPTDALAAAAALQQALLAEPWPAETPLRVRMALHADTAVARAGDYYGPGVNRCARVRAVAHGGQVLVSQAVYDAAWDQLPAGASLRDLGMHRLRDLQQPQRLFQLLHPELPADFPPLRSLEAFAHNLPRQLTSFIGREREIAEVKQLLATTCMLTLTGTGGSGKTRLALQVAGDLLEEFADGVWLVELAALAEPALVPQAVASTLGIREEPERLLPHTLADSLRPRSLLLLLDNCEHLLDVSAQLADSLLRACPRLRILATSRERLGITGETAYPVGPLSVPDVKQVLPVGMLTRSEAVQLFLERALAVLPSFSLNDQSAATVAEVCRRLDGIPLAIELAAARVKALSVDQIVARLDDMFRLLTGGSRAALPRQQTMRALIDWSYELLSEAERSLLRRLSVFSGGGNLEAAEAVCAGDGIEMWEVLDLLTALVEKSLVQYEPGNGETRYRLLETVRQYGRDRLLESGEVAALRQKHRDWYLNLAESVEHRLILGETLSGRPQIVRELDNLRAALEWSQIEPDGAEKALQLVGAIGNIWVTTGLLSEGRGWVERALARMEETAPASPVERRTCARAAYTAGVLAWHQGDAEVARSQLEEGLAISREIDYPWGIAWSLLHLGQLARSQGEYAAARALLEESLSICKGAAYPHGTAWGLNCLGVLANDEGDTDAASAFCEESLVLFQKMEDQVAVAWSLFNLGQTARRRGDYERAAALYEECLVLFRETGNRRSLAYTLEGLAMVAAEQAERGSGEAGPRAASLFGAAEALREAVSAFLLPADRAEYDRHRTATRAALGEDAFAAAWAAGRALTPDDAITYALQARPRLER